MKEPLLIFEMILSYDLPYDFLLQIRICLFHWYS